MVLIRVVPTLIRRAVVAVHYSSLPILVLCVDLGCSGCGPVLRVQRTPVVATAPPTSVAGVPFYTKRARCRQEIVWLQPIYTLTLTALIPDKNGTLQSHPRGAVILSRSAFVSSSLTDLIKLLNNRPTDEGTVQRSWQTVVALASANTVSADFASLDPKDRILVGRSAAPVVYVDYANQYFINAKSPLAGTANLDAKLAPDGSLTEASGQRTDNTLQTVSSALPISTIITGELGLGGKSLAPSGSVEAFQLTISATGFRHTLARQVDYPTDQTPCPLAADIGLNDATEYKREDVLPPSNNNSAQKNQATTTDKPPASDGQNPQPPASTDKKDGGSESEASTGPSNE
jgi:hypothetical protein